MLLLVKTPLQPPLAVAVANQVANAVFTAACVWQAATVVLVGQVSATGGGAPPAGAGPDLTEAAEALGVTVDELRTALGGPPPDIEGAAEALGVSAEELRAVLPQP